MKIPFNRPACVGNETHYLLQAIENRRLSGDGPFTARCHQWLEQSLQCAKVLLTHSCTGALEMAALLSGVGAGDEVILPSFTFVSTANAFVLRGAVPVFVDIRTDTLNLDESRIEEAITSKTRAILPVHYAGVSCEMDSIQAIAKRHNLLVIEDAAQALLSTYKGKFLGTLGDLGTMSFHETKNVTCGEGGALLLNRSEFNEPAEIIREKGTNRSRFYRGEIDKYTWVDVGSSYLPSELNAGFLLAQLEKSREIAADRIAVWNKYHAVFAPLEAKEVIRRPIVPEGCGHNGHMYYLLMRDADHRTRVIRCLNELGIGSVFHYVPLHSSPAGRKYGRSCGELRHTDNLSSRLLRLPLWPGLDQIHPEVFEIIPQQILAAAG
jgi:dTDP-4-amino-4,6-dideoxygalactose transaminase